MAKESKRVLKGTIAADKYADFVAQVKGNNTRATIKTEVIRNLGGRIQYEITIISYED